MMFLFIALPCVTLYNLNSSNEFSLTTYKHPCCPGKKLGCCIPNTTASQETAIVSPASFFCRSKLSPIFLHSSFFLSKTLLLAGQNTSWLWKLSVMLPKSTYITDNSWFKQRKMNPHPFSFHLPFPKTNLYISSAPVQIKPRCQRRDLERGARPLQCRFKKLYKWMNCWTQVLYLKNTFHWDR